jgi:glutathione synthase/RimK-type ligase-like ATP-grasp enzyme
MRIGIHQTKGSFSDRWINYWEEKNIPYKLVNCYANNIIEQLADCDALMWHFHHASPRDFLFAKQLLYSIQSSGKVVFPDFNTMWHFDDKVGQKYLLEIMNAPLVPSYVFYSKQEALDWAGQTQFPKVFKLRSGAGSQQVRLVRNYTSARKLINRAFGRGFSQYPAWSNLKDRIKKYRRGLISLFDVTKGFIRLVYPTKFSKTSGKEKGYIYFQDFVPGNDSDIRVVVIDDKAFAIKRMVRENDFRASGSGTILYDKSLFDEQIISLSFELSNKVNTQCVAFDFVYHDEMPLLLEISYGFSPEGYDPCPGYWDDQLNWKQGSFDPYGWMVDLVVKEIYNPDE